MIFACYPYLICYNVIKVFEKLKTIMTFKKNGLGQEFI